jgi:ketosteroid isomerase-like protein
MALDDAAMIARVREVMDAYSRQDFDAVVALNHPDVVIVRAGGLPRIHGVKALREWMEPDAFDSQAIEPLDFRVNGNRVVARQRNRIRGAGSGIDTDFYSWSVWTLDDAGAVTRVELFQEHEEDRAMDAAGLGD